MAIQPFMRYKIINAWYEVLIMPTDPEFHSEPPSESRRGTGALGLFQLLGLGLLLMIVLSVLIVVIRSLFTSA
jgi:hypothetical protein